MTNNTLKGIGFLLAAMALLSVMDAFAKMLVHDGMSVFQIIAIRSLVIVPSLLIGFRLSGQFQQLKPTRPVAQALRGVIGTIAPLAFFAGLLYMPLSAAVVIFFSSTFMTALGSIIFLGEKVGRHRWSAIVIGYIGVIIAMSPTEGGDLLGYVLILTGSAMYTFLFVTGKLLTRTETVSSLVLSYNLWGGLACLSILPWVWMSPTPEQWLILILLALFAVGGHYCSTLAFANAEASLLAPFEYASLIWAIMLDLVLWGELPGWSTWLGAAVIITSGLYLTWREYWSGRLR